MEQQFPTFQPLCNAFLESGTGVNPISMFVVCVLERPLNMVKTSAINVEKTK